jgi:hypothetical protein
MFLCSSSALARVAAILKTYTTAAATVSMFAAGVAHSTCRRPPPGRRRLCEPLRGVLMAASTASTFLGGEHALLEMQ